MGFRLFSEDLVERGTLPKDQVFNQFGFDGNNVSPHLAWDGAPEGTKSFVITLYDPDAPTGSGWWHWVVINIPADVHELLRGAGSGGAALPARALQTRTDFGSAGYGGAAPPPGAPHRYIFSVLALGVEKLGLDADASGAMVGFMANMNILGKAHLTVTFGV
jgi:Raf kinase inhibitor-like YbhB/YbcL family protein